MKIDLVYCAWNRLAFTRFTFERLLENTDWSKVARLVIYDDGSTDGTEEYLREAATRAPVVSEMVFDSGFGSSVGALQHFVSETEGEEVFAFVENDLAVPKGWLEAMTQVMEVNPELELLGMEPAWNGPPPLEGEWKFDYGYSDHVHIGGSGLMRRSAFQGREPFPGTDMASFEVWQSTVGVKAGWILPDLAVMLLDRHPADPWRSLSREYEAKGWQRPWQVLDPEQHSYYWHWFPDDSGEPRTFFVATKHAAYAEQTFPEGSVVIDPFRYIPDQRGVTVKRIGQNRPELISLLVPTRERPREFTRMVDSAQSMATHIRDVEIVAYFDRDDDADEYPRRDGLSYRVGDRVVLSEMWNECYRLASGEILMHCGDDLIFRTPGWDSIVREAFRSVPDRIVLVHGDDGSPNFPDLATHSFLHRNWVEAVGYFVPPYFSSDWNDVWLTDVADMIGRRVQVPILTDHMHFAFGKGVLDETHRQRIERGERDKVTELYAEKLPEREADAAKLRAVMSDG